MVDIIGLLDSDHSLDFNNWKKNRPALITRLGQLLVECSEAEITKSFDDCGVWINDNIRIEKPKSQLTALMALSIRSHFLGDVGHFKTSSDSFIALLSSKTRDVVLAAVQFLKWLVKDIPDCRSSVFKAPLENAFLWVRTKKVKLYFNALVIIKSGAEFDPSSVVQNIVSNYQDFFEMVRSEDPVIRLLAVDAIVFQQPQLSQQGSFDHVKRAIADSWDVVQSKNGPAIHGTIVMLNKLYKLHPVLFTPFLDDVTKCLSDICLMPLDSMAVSACYDFVIDMAEQSPNIFGEEHVNRIFQGIYQRVMKNQFPERYLAILERLIRAFRSVIDVNKVKAQVLKVFQPSQTRKVVSAAFRVLTTLIQIMPETTIPVGVFQGSQTCWEYLECLKQMVRVPTEVRPALTEFVKRGLSQNAHPNTIDLACKTVQMFQLQLFDSYDEMFQTVKPVYVGASELIREEVVRTLACIPTDDVQTFLMNIAAFDQSKRVRQLALSTLKPTSAMSLNTQILVTIYDSSFKIRRKGLKFIAKLVKHNPFDFSCRLSEFASEVLQTVNTQSDLRVVAKNASVLPIIAKHMKNEDFVKPLVPNMINTCLKLLGVPMNTEKDSEEQLMESSPSKKGSIYDDVVRPDGLADPKPCILASEEADKVEAKRIRIFKTVYEKAMSQRDKCLLKTLANLGELVAPVLDKALSAFYKILTTKTSTSLLASAIKSLSILSMNMNTGLNLRLHHQHFIPVLMKLLISTQGNEVSVAILKLFGTSCDSVTTTEASASEQKELCVDLTSDSFFADFTIRHLVPFFDQPRWEMFEVVGRIYDLAPKEAAKFVPLVIPMFFKGIETGSESHRPSLFAYLEIIIRECPVESAEFLPELTQIQLKFFLLPASIKLAAALSFHLMSSYVSQAAILYPAACRMMGTETKRYLKYLMKFLSFAVMFQAMPFENMLKMIETTVRKPNSTLSKSAFMKLVVDALICLVQHVDLFRFQARLALLLSTILQQEQCRGVCMPLISTMVVHMNLPVEVVESWQFMYNLHIPNLGELKDFSNCQTKSLAKIPSLKQVKPDFKDFHPPNTVQETVQGFFLRLRVPGRLNSREWLDNLCQQTITQSPSLVIRACGPLANTIPTFSQQIFPVAFLCCWQKASDDEKKYFSEIVRNVLASFEHVNPFFVQLIEILDRASCPLNIADCDLSKAVESESRPLALFLLQRMFKNDMKDSGTIERLLDLNTTMGRHSAAHGMLIHAKGLLEDTSAALWSERLGEWERALKLYGDCTTDISSILRCYAHLEMWDKIKEMAGQFEQWDTPLKEETAKHFAWAYYNSGDFNKVEYYMKQFHSDQHLSEVLFNGFFFLRTARYQECQQTIVKAFDLLARDTSVYSSGDAIRLHKNLHYCHMFIELQEALDILCRDKLETDLAPHLWNKRLKGFSRDSESWIRLIAIRSLVFSPGEYITVYLKMISVLRKERRWNLIDTYFDRFFSKSMLPTVELAQGKILWARGRKDEAIDLLQGTLDVIDMKSDKDTFGERLSRIHRSKFYVLFLTLMKQKSFDVTLQNEAMRIIGGVKTNDGMVEKIGEMDQDSQKEFVLHLHEAAPKQFEACFSEILDSFQVDGTLVSRLCRKLADFLSTRDTHNKEMLAYIANLYERGKTQNDKDYKLWLGWAYANARMIDICPSEGDIYSINATHGFLRATTLSTSNTLEFLCQMFSMFFRVKDSSKITLTLKHGLLSLHAKAISQVIPQLTIQIAHPDSVIRQVVHSILHAFGKEHFQMLFYPLKLYERSGQKEKAEIARELLSDLGRDHAQEASDADEFVEGMLRAAISSFEQWITTLSSASRAFHDNNIEKMDNILKAQFHQFKHPMCSFENMFVKQHGPVIRHCMSLFETHNSKSLGSMWEVFKELWLKLKASVKKLDLVLLPKVSDTLAKKQKFAIAIPGTYSVDRKVPFLRSIEPALQVLGTQQRPRCVFMVGSDGKRVKFLLKGNQDIRLDQRVMQFFGLINSLLNKTRISADGVAKIVKYAIIPLAPNVGLISWVTGADTLHQVILEQRHCHGISESRDIDLLKSIVGEIFESMLVPQRLEVFREVAKECKANEVRDALWQRAPNAAAWMMQNQHFTVTTALMSMVGYCIGLGDRHPSNIMVQKETGKVIHIDFGDSFEVAMLREKYPERVPFRLTRMITNALDSGTVEGVFRKTCEDVMWILRDSRASLVALLEIFVHEPLDDEEGDEKSQTKIIDRVGQKLAGRDNKLRYADEDDGKCMDIETHVDALIREAIDPSNYIVHYSGWCVFW